MDLERYNTQIERWPIEGEHILAQYDEDSIVVYQAYRPSIGHFAAKHQYFGGEDFKYTRMSWIKPNFLWMMYRSGWGTKPGQEVTLAVRLKRPFFDRVVEQAVPSSFIAADFESRDAWKAAIERSNVRQQWDPDHNPTGAKVQRRAIQLGLRGEALAEYGRDAIVEIKDISQFVAEQRVHAKGNFENLMTPRERVYPGNLTKFTDRL